MNTIKFPGVYWSKGRERFNTYNKVKITVKEKRVYYYNDEDSPLLMFR